MSGDGAAGESKGGRLPPGGGGRRSPGPRWTNSEKPRDFRKGMGDLIGHMGCYRYAILLGIVLSMAGAVLSVIGPQYLQQLADSIYDGEEWLIDMETVTRLTLTIAAVYGLSMAFSIAEHFIIPAASQRFAGQLRREMNAKIDRLPLNYFDNSRTGDIMSRVTNDADTVGDSCGISLNILFTSLTTLIGCAVMMVLTNPVLAVATLVPSVAGFVCIRLIILKTHPLYVRQSRDMGRMNSVVEECYYGHDIVMAYGAEDMYRERFSEINDDLFGSVRKSRFVSSLLPQLMGFIGNLNYVIVCIVGSMLVIGGEITYGVVVAFIVYVKLFSNPLLQLSEALAGMQSLAAASERIFDLLDAPELGSEDGKDGSADDIEGKVEFRNVSFGYVTGSEVIHDFNLAVNPGEKVAIVGPTGAGKTTIVNLLMRFYEVDSGSIEIDGEPVGEMTRAKVHSMFSMVLQDSWLFDGTVADNIRFNRPDISDEEIREACEAVGIDGFVSSLPEGYGTRIDDSAGLSGGQRQQIAIARALVRPAPMVIFDEATSSVDTRTEKKIQAAMDRLTRGRTSFIIAHRLSTIRDCDRIIVMAGGKMVESGTHSELLAKGGFYADLYNSQFENCD